MTQDYCKK